MREAGTGRVVERVLVVEDDEQLLADYRRSLERLADVVTLGARALPAARRLLHEHQIESVVLDVQLGSDDGLDLIPEIVQRDSRIRVVVATGHPSCSRALRAGREGAIEFVEKPLTASELVARVMGWPVDAEELETVPLARVEVEHARRVYGDCGRKLKLAARKLGISPNRLRRLLAAT